MKRQLRWFAMLTAGVLVGIFATITLLSNPANAQPVWSGQTIVDNGDSYPKITDTQVLSGLGNPTNVDVYGFLKTTGNNKLMQTIQVPAGSPTDQAVNARMVIYNFTPPNTYTEQSSSDISVQVDTSTSGASCNVDGVGWLVCSLSNWIAGGMDWIYWLLTDLMKTPAPKQDDPRDSIRMAWEIMRNIANAAFVIMFIVIIYSHITSFGISNYGVKKMLPRLIIASIAMNLSLVICVFFIDISNILGVALQEMFNGIRDNLITNATNNSGNVTNWSDITTLILAGGAGVAATQGVITSGTPLLVPLLLTMMLAMVVVFIVLAARQALIVILTIISPLAFALYLLPGTEKWFEKWRETMFTMLLFFPAFAVVFGGAQLAGTVILMMPNVSLIMTLLGLAVQVAPLAIAPLVLKLGGGVLNRLAGVVNNPSKGLIDKSKQWADEQSEAIKLKRWAAADKRLGGKGDRKWYNPIGSLRRGMRGLDHMGRSRKANLERLRKEADNTYHESDQFKKLDLKSRQTNDMSSLIEQENSNRYDALKAGQMPTDIVTAKKSVLHRVPFVSDAKRAEADAKLADKATQIANTMSADAQALAERLAAAGIQKTIAQRTISSNVANRMLADRNLQELAGGLYGEAGIDITIASAVATNRSEFAKSVQESAELMKHFKVDSNQRQSLIRGKDIEVEDRAGNKYTFKHSNEYAMEVALEEQVAVGTVEQVTEILKDSGGRLAAYRGTISAALAKSGIKGKAPFYGGKLIDDVYKGAITDMNALNKYLVEWVNGGKFKPSDVSMIDKQGLEVLMGAIGDAYDSPQRAAIDEIRLKGLRYKIEQVFKDPQLTANMADNTFELFKKLRNSLPKAAEGELDLISADLDD